MNRSFLDTKFDCSKSIYYNKKMTNILVKGKNFETLIRRTVIESVQGVLTDPDYAFEISEIIAKRLNKYSKNISSNKFTSIRQIKHKYL